MYQSFSFDAEREKRALPFYPRSNRGLVFVTKPSRKQNLFFQNKFIIFIDNLRVVTTEGEVVDALVRSAEVSMMPSATSV